MARDPLSAADSQRHLEAAVFVFWLARAKVRALSVALLGTWALMLAQITFMMALEDLAVMEALRLAGAIGTLGGVALSMALNLVTRLPSRK